jgi:tetratricopeptide (TPR) repeat protein
MGSRTAERVSACLRLLCGFSVFALAASALTGQATPSPEDLLKQAESLHRAGKLDQAIKDYRLFLEQYPNVAPVRSDLGAALAGAGRYEEAILEYQRALRLEANPEIEFNLALAYYKTAQLFPAVESLKKVHREIPNDLRPVMLLADCYLRLGDNKKVIDLLGPLEPTHSDDQAVIYMLGTALVRDGQAAKGQVVIDKILRNGDSAEARLLLGTTKLRVYDIPGALRDLQRAVELNPNLPDVYAYYGLALLSSGNPVRAQEAFERALRADSNNFEANLQMGVLLRQDERFDAALRYLHHALEIRPGDLGVRYQIASAELAMGQVEKARADLEKIVTEAPDFTEAHVSLATVYYREKRKADGDRERDVVRRLAARQSANEKRATAP